MELTELIDVEEFRRLCESFTAQTRAVLALLDLEGNIIVATGWQDICTKFHRVHPVTAQRCRESDTILAGKLRQRAKYNVYQCKNGLIDVAFPIIIEDKHIANFFTGQFFFEKPDKKFFIQQAEEFGFDKETYLKALDNVPVISEDKIRSMMEFFTLLVNLVTRMGVTQKQLKDINETLEQRIESAVNELRKKDQLMILQNRQAAMGEMISNIAHQWKQPLNNLGIILQSMSLEYSGGLLTPEELEADQKKCFELISFMSQTVDDFRYFFLTDKLKENFGIRQAVTRTLGLLSASLLENNIKVKVEPGDEVQVSGYPNEYAQVLLNLLGNARDVFIERKIAAPLITIDIFTRAGQAVTTINDNGGGIPLEVLNQVFDPFFTTKLPDKGTGIGLFLSKNIIEKRMGGSLTVDNHDTGARFKIEMSLQE